MLAYITIIRRKCLTCFNAVKSPTANCLFWDITLGTINHINVFVVYLFAQGLFFDKNHFLEFLSIGYSVAL